MAGHGVRRERAPRPAEEQGVADGTVVRVPLHVGAAPDGSECSRPAQAADVVLAATSGGPGGRAMEYRFHLTEPGTYSAGSDRATGGLWTTRGLWGKRSPGPPAPRLPARHPRRDLCAGPASWVRA